MEFGDNLLPHDSGMYTLVNASIVNGILHMNPSSHVLYNITEADIASATEYFRVSLLYDSPTDNYVPRTRAHIHLELEDGTCYDQALFPTEFPNNLYYQELQMHSGAYRRFTFELFSEDAVTFNLWELCPEAADEDIQVIIDGVTQSLPRLLFDYNTWAFTIAQNEMTVALITFRLLDATDLQGHFQMTYTASESCTLVLRFKSNTATELFAPLTYDLNAGRGSVGVPHAYLDRLAGIHTCTVTAQVTSGSLYIDTRGILFTIDGGYLAERMLDIGVDMRDISIRQLAEDYGPDEIWIIGIEAGEALVRKRPYSSNANITFEPQFSLGEAIDAAIEFDGIWTLRPDDENYTIETYENPWVFWIDGDNNLYAQIGSDDTTKVLLDTSVTDLSVVRGYKSEEYRAQDQGLVCLYIKNARAYYRQYEYSAADGLYAWRDIYSIGLEEFVTHVSVQRLNDYRLGMNITTTSNNYWYITDRTYVAQATPPEHLYISASPTPTIGIIHYEREIESLIVDTTMWCEISFTEKDDVQLIATSNYDIRYLKTNPLECFDYMPESMGYDIKLFSINSREIIFVTTGPVLGNLHIVPKIGCLQYYVPDVGWYPVPSDIWYFRPYSIAEGLSISIGVVPKINIKGLETIKLTHEETLQMQIGVSTVNIQTKAITITPIELSRETLTIQFNNIVPTVTVSWVGDQPI